MLSLENNNITTIQNMAFSHSPNLEFLDLNNNHISSLQNYPFNGTRLWYINLEGNDLWYIFPQWFSSVRDTLLLLDVANNDLTYLASDVFAELTNLVELEIGFNSLRWEFFKFLPSKIKIIDIFLDPSMNQPSSASQTFNTCRWFQVRSKTSTLHGLLTWAHLKFFTLRGTTWGDCRVGCLTLLSTFAMFTSIKITWMRSTMRLLRHLQGFERSMLKTIKSTPSCRHSSIIP